MNGWFLIPILLPALAGMILVALSFHDHRAVSLKTGGKVNIPQEGDLKHLHRIVALVMAISMVSVLYIAWSGEHSFTLFHFMDQLPIYFKIDEIGRLFATLVTLIWALAGIFSFAYMEHEGSEKRYFGFYMIVYTVLILLDFSGNLITMYFFYELMTLTSFPLVLHSGIRESIMASLKYLFYSMCGAYCGLFGIFFLYRNCTTMTFTAGGTLAASAADNKGILLIAIFLMCIGFGAKAGMFPLHSWLPSAHPVAPSPASAVLSALIVKCGVLALIRSIYYIVGPDFIRGTWVQYAWIILALITVFMGSMMAYIEPVLKKRLAYSTVSQVSYIIFGLALLTESGFQGALLHVVFHAVIKCGLFLSAGVLLFYTHKTRVEDYVGLGKISPVFTWCWTFFSLGLIGIPPFNGFLSKWYLAQGALEAGVGVFAYIGPAVLLISALLTAGYLLPLTIQGFFPGEKKITMTWDGKVNKLMLAPLIILAALTLILGVIPGPVMKQAAIITSIVF